MDEIDLAMMRHKLRNNEIVETNKKDSNKISKLFTKILLSIILVLGCTIYVKLSPDNMAWFKENIFESNLTFTKINNWYHEVFGSVLPSVTEQQDLTASSNIQNVSREPYLDGYKMSSIKNSPVTSIQSGLLVFMGEKEGYGNTFIIQGVDGVDVWYGGIVDTDFKLYDYVEKDSILGNTTEDYYYLVFKEDNEFLTYEDYIQEA